MPLACDIIVPTHNNSSVLPLTLKNLFGQCLPEPWSPRLIICDDGSSDTTASVAKSLKAPPAWRPTLVIEQEHSGAAAARNSGVYHSQANLIMFLGADIVLRPKSLFYHLSFHEQHPSFKAAALGLVIWDPVICPTPFMEWATHGGNQNNFDALLGNRTANPHDFFYGSFLSIKKSALPSRPFCESFSCYGWEDLELGNRLGKEGLKLFVLHNAIGLHHHYYSTSQIIKRQFKIGHSLVEYQSAHPQETLIPTQTTLQKTKHLTFRLTGLGLALRLLLLCTSKTISTPRLFKMACSSQLWRGLNQARRKNILNKTN